MDLSTNNQQQQQSSKGRSEAAKKKAQGTYTISRKVLVE